MAIKKSDLYSSLWASCDELRGGMDASQYKDYVLFMLFIKYVSDKYADSDDFAPAVVIPPGALREEYTGCVRETDTGLAGQRIVSGLGAGSRGHAGRVRSAPAPIRLLMSERFQLGDVAIEVTRKAIKHVHLSVHPPTGRVTLSAPLATRLEVARAYAISKLGWIKAQQSRLRSQARETPRRFVTRESHHLWGRRHLLSIVERDTKPALHLDHKRITLSVRPGTSRQRRAELMHEWHKSLLHAVVPEFIRGWEAKLGVTVRGYFLQRMKTKWGSCNHRAGHIRLNTELVKKPRDLLEYVIVHEMLHLVEPTHSDRFLALLDRFYPTWPEARAELNELPLTAERWGP